MLTTEPPSFFSICGTAARVSAWAVETLKWNASSRYAGSVSSSAFGIVPPTLFTTMSSRPNSSYAASARPATASRSIRLAGTTRARRPAASTSLATCWSWSAVREERTTSAPASARATALAAPIPRPAPVTTATFPSTLKRSRIMRENVTRSSSGWTSLRSPGFPRRPGVLWAGGQNFACQPGVSPDVRGNLGRRPPSRQVGQRLPGERHLEQEGGAVAVLGLDAHGAAVALRDLLGDEQAQ